MRLLRGWLRRLREEAGLTHRGVADKVKQPQWWVHRSEIGSRRSDDAEFLVWCDGCSVDAQAALQRLRKGE